MDQRNDFDLRQPSGCKIICIRELSNTDCSTMACRRFPLCPINVEKRKEEENEV